MPPSHHNPAVDSFGQFDTSIFGFVIAYDPTGGFVTGAGWIDSQAGAYKPSAKTFRHAHEAIGVTPADIVHICASPHLDLAAARDMGFRCIWIDRGTGREPLPDYTPDLTFPALDKVPAHFAGIGWN